MIAEGSLNRWERRPVTANDRRWRWLGARGAGLIPHAAEGPHYLGFLLFLGEPPIDTGDLLDDPLSNWVL
jgi:hypothetical protein